MENTRLCHAVNLYHIIFAKSCFIQVRTVLPGYVLWFRNASVNYAKWKEGLKDKERSLDARVSQAWKTMCGQSAFGATIKCRQDNDSAVIYDYACRNGEILMGPRPWCYILEDGSVHNGTLSDNSMAYYSYYFSERKFWDPYDPQFRFYNRFLVNPPLVWTYLS